MPTNWSPRLIPKSITQPTMQGASALDSTMRATIIARIDPR